jgi:uncharacterized membrane protein
MNKLLLSSLLSFAACASTPSGASCPDSSAPTYGSDGMAFFAKYCTDCHSSASTNRHGAPSDINFDTIDDIRAHADDIDVEAAAGPKATNSAMPELDAFVTAEPTQAEREMLGGFLACVKEGKN